MAYFEMRSSQLEVILIRQMLIAPMHIHDLLEVVYCRDGELDITIDDVNYRLERSDVAVICPLVVHSYNVSARNGVDGVIFIVNTALYPALGDMLSDACPVSPVIRSRDISGAAFYALSALCNICENPLASGSELKSIAWLGVALTELCTQMTMAERTLSARDTIMRTILYLQQNFRQPLTLNQAAAATGTSPNYLSALFSKQLRISFHTLLNAMRLNHALDMLRHSDLPVTEICYDCGFSSLRTFNRVFMDSFGMTPRQLRSMAHECSPSGISTSGEHMKVFIGYDY